MKNLMFGILVVGFFDFGGSLSANESCQTEKPELDHIIWAVSDLNKGANEFENMTGVKAAFGGVHKGGATANYLVSLSPCLYLEIIGPNPGGDPSPMADFFRQLKSPTLYGYAVHSSDLALLAKKGQEAGLTVVGPEGNGRARPDGVMLNWEAITFGGHEVTDFMPFVINWKDSPHPAMSAPKGITLKSFEVSHPKGEELERIFNALGISIPVMVGQLNLNVVLNTPKGEVILKLNLGE